MNESTSFFIVKQKTFRFAVVKSEMKMLSLQLKCGLLSAKRHPFAS